MRSIRVMAWCLRTVQGPNSLHVGYVCRIEGIEPARVKRDEEHTLSCALLCRRHRIPVHKQLIKTKLVIAYMDYRYVAHPSITCRRGSLSRLRLSSAAACKAACCRTRSVNTSFRRSIRRGTSGGGLAL